MIYVLVLISICRAFDNSNEGFRHWEFMTVHCWGERAEGEWTLEVRDMPSQVRHPAHQGTYPLSSLSHVLTERRGLDAAQSAAHGLVHHTTLHADVCIVLTKNIWAPAPSCFA